MLDVSVSPSIEIPWNTTFLTRKRTRKVKCDEGRPVCGQCSRLGHSCDYSPRLAFRDDTPRILERMQEVTIVTSSVWDRKLRVSSVMTCSCIDDVCSKFSRHDRDQYRLGPPR
jgi:hypothetical protein